MESSTVSALNAATDASLTARAGEAATVPAPKVAKPAVKRAAAKPKPKTPTVPVKTARTPRRAMTPKERAAKPATATIVSYVDWLAKNVFGRKLTGPERRAAEISITLYGAYQISPERKLVRDGK